MSMPPTAMRLMRWQSSHRVMADSILAAVVLILNVLLGLGPVLTANTPIASWLPITITAIALCTAALCVRRTYPVVAWAAVVLIPTAHDIAIYHIYHFDPQTFTIIVNSLPAYNVIAIPMCLAALAMRRRPSWVWAAAFASAAPSTITSIWLEGLSVTETGLVYLVSCLICIIGALIGMLLRIQEVQLQEMRMRSVRLALAREQEALLSAANERSRIAREMHDVVAHRISLIALHAGALAHHMRSEQGEAGDLARAIQTNAQSSLDELRAMLARLRGNAAPPEPPQPTLSGLDALLADARSAGQQVAVELDGDPAEVPDRVSRHAYRIVQEGLTNARKHAPGAPVTLSLKTTADRLRVVVRNRLADLAQPDRSGSGLGLVGIAERVDLVGGDLSHGIKGGEFILEATLPYAPEGTA